MESKVTFVIICFGETTEFYISIGSLLCQTNPNWKALVMHDGPSDATRQIVESFNDPRVTYFEAPVNEGSWGCHNRLRSFSMVKEDYIVQMTAQEYMAPVLVSEILKYPDADLIFWNSAHHHFQYTLLDSDLKINKIDWSNFAIKTEIAKKVGIKDPSNFRADGLFIEDVLKSRIANKAVKIPKILTIKN